MIRAILLASATVFPLLDITVYDSVERERTTIGFSATTS
jgi:hypothetical protein